MLDLRAMERLIAMLLCAVLLAGCAPRAASSRSPQAIPTVADQTPLYFCWFVEQAPEGTHGYAMGYGWTNWQPPEGRSHFDTISELRKALYKPGSASITIIPRYPSSIPSGWVIRGLTDEETKSLR